MVRACGMNKRGFRHGGLDVGPTWAELPALSDKARDALREFHGRFVRVHPDDRSNLAKELGLEFVTEKAPLVEAKKSTPPPKGDSTKSAKKE